MAFYFLLNSAAVSVSVLLDAWLRDPIKLGIGGFLVMGGIILLARRMERRDLESRRVTLSGRKRRSR